MLSFSARFCGCHLVRQQPSLNSLLLLLLAARQRKTALKNIRKKKKNDVEKKKKMLMRSCIYKKNLRNKKNHRIKFNRQRKQLRDQLYDIIF